MEPALNTSPQDQVPKYPDGFENWPLEKKEAFKNDEPLHVEGEMHAESQHLSSGQIKEAMQMYDKAVNKPTPAPISEPVLNERVEPDDEEEVIMPEAEKSELALEIENVKGFNELYEVLRKTAGIKTPEKFYEAGVLIADIEVFRLTNSYKALENITEAEGLRTKVVNLLSIVERSKPETLTQNITQEPVPANPEPVVSAPEPVTVLPEQNVSEPAIFQEEIQANYVPEWQRDEEWAKFEKARVERAKAEIEYKKIVLYESKKGILLNPLKFGFSESKDERFDKYNDLKDEKEDTQGDYNDLKNNIAQNIKETFRKNAGENLTPDQEADLQSKIHDKIFEELTKGEAYAYRKAVKEAKGETKLDKALEKTRELLNTKAAQWYLKQNKWARLAVTTTLFTVGGYALGTAAVGGTLFSAGAYGAGRLGRGAASILGGGAARGAAEKYWTEEKINEKFKEKEKAIKESSGSQEEQSREYEKLLAWEDKEKKRIKRNKTLVTIGVGAGSGILAGLTEGAVSGKGISSVAESKGGKAGDITENKLPPRKGIEFVPLKPTNPVTEIPTEPVVAPVEKIFDKPEVLIHEVQAGDSTWKILKGTLENNEQFKGMTEAQKTYVLSNLTNKVLQNPENYGLSKGGGLNIGNKTDFTKLFEDAKGVKSILKEAKEKIVEGGSQEKSILANNEKIAGWVNTNPDRVLDEDQVTEILSDKPQTVPTPVAEIPTEPVVIRTSKVLEMSDMSAPEPEVVPEAPAPLAKPLVNMAKGETVMAGGLGMAGMAGMSILEREKREQMHQDIAEAKLRLGVLEGGKNSRNPNLERSLSGDSQFARDKNEIENTIRETFRKAIDYIYGKKGFMGIGRVEGLNTKKWIEIDGNSAKELVQYTEGELERAKLPPKLIKAMESPENQQFIAEMKHLIEETGGVVTARERERPGEFMMRLSKFITNKQPQLQNLAKAA